MNVLKKFALLVLFTVCISNCTSPTSKGFPTTVSITQDKSFQRLVGAAEAIQKLAKKGFYSHRNLRHAQEDIEYVSTKLNKGSKSKEMILLLPKLGFKGDELGNALVAYNNAAVEVAKNYSSNQLKTITNQQIDEALFVYHQSIEVTAANYFDENVCTDCWGNNCSECSGEFESVSGGDPNDKDKPGSNAHRACQVKKNLAYAAFHATENSLVYALIRDLSVFCHAIGVAAGGTAFSLTALLNLIPGAGQVLSVGVGVLTGLVVDIDCLISSVLTYNREIAKARMDLANNLAAAGNC